MSYSRPAWTKDDPEGGMYMRRYKSRCMWKGATFISKGDGHSQRKVFAHLSCSIQLFLFVSFEVAAQGVYRIVKVLIMKSLSLPHRMDSLAVVASSIQSVHVQTDDRELERKCCMRNVAV